MSVQSSNPAEAGEVVKQSDPMPFTIASRVGGPELSLIVPTFNERDNVEPLLMRLEATLCGIEWEVIFLLQCLQHRSGSQCRHRFRRLRPSLHLVVFRPRRCGNRRRLELRGLLDLHLGTKVSFAYRTPAAGTRAIAARDWLERTVVVAAATRGIA
jgi:hypothetical protein